MRRQKNSSRPPNEVKVDMTSMIDVTFLLLIFFIVTLNFRTLEKKLSLFLPADSGPKRTAITDERKITVRLDQFGETEDPRPLIRRRTRISVEGTRLGGDGKRALDRMEEHLARFRNVQRDARGLIETGVGVPQQRVVEVLDRFQRAGYQRVDFAGSPNGYDRAWFSKVRERLAR